MMRRPVVVVGLLDDGCRSLSSRAIDAIAQSQVLVGGERQLAFFPEFHGERLVVKADVEGVIRRVGELMHEQRVCVLASGDPLFFGLGTRLAASLGREHVEVLPQPSSVQLAFAKLALGHEDAQVISLHGRPLAGLVVRLRRVKKAAVLTDKENTPARVAEHMLAFGATDFTAHVCERLSGPGERVRSFALEALTAVEDVDPLNVLVLTRNQPHFQAPPLLGAFHEVAFAKRMPKKGLITKREVRVASLGAMGIRPDSVIWDVGAGSGSVGIEAALMAYEGRAYGIEVDPESAALARDNAQRLGADNVRIVEGHAPEALEDLEAPDAVFVGGSKGSMTRILDLAFARLRPGGSLVVNAITLENAHESYAWARARGLTPEVMMLAASRAEPLAHYMRYEAQNPVQILSVYKPAEHTA
jgi:precorrin-6Y C5,15-methyltransferase (decarboxylating)